jgi:hypothetical protein
MLETSAVVPLPIFKTYQNKDMKEPKTQQYAAMIVAVELNGEHLLFVAQHNVLSTYEIKTGRELTDADRLAWKHGMRTGWAEQRAKDRTLSSGTITAGIPWVRLATSPSPIASLKGTTDEKGRITIQYTTSDGVPQTVHLNESRHLGR